MAHATGGGVRRALAPHFLVSKNISKKALFWGTEFKFDL